MKTQLDIIGSDLKTTRERLQRARDLGHDKEAERLQGRIDALNQALAKLREHKISQVWQDYEK